MHGFKKFETFQMSASPVYPNTFNFFDTLASIINKWSSDEPDRRNVPA